MTTCALRLYLVTTTTFHMLTSIRKVILLFLVPGTKRLKFGTATQVIASELLQDTRLGFDASPYQRMVKFLPLLRMIKVL